MRWCSGRNRIRFPTVRNHLRKILHKLGVHSQREAVKLAVEHRLV